MMLSKKCPICGAILAADTPPGQCPACLLKLGFAAAVRAEESQAQAAAAFADTPAELPPSLPRVLGDYVLLERIGEGGMGVVYRARQRSLDRVVAFKLMRGAACASTRALARFHLEAQAAARLDHPNIVSPYEFGEHDGQPWFSMKWIDGGSLAERIRGEADDPTTPAAGRLGLPSAALTLMKVARAVHYAHQHGVLHRDLKPANILLDRDGTPYLTDFGIAKFLLEDLDVTGTLELLGTPSYMAPEQIAGQPASVASDVYSLGAILYQLLAGRPPFTGTTTLEMLRKVTEEQPMPLRQLAERRTRSRLERGKSRSAGIRDSQLQPFSTPGVPRDLETVCLTCLEKDPSRRYPNAAALAEELERFLRGEPITARPVRWQEKWWRWCRRKPALAGSLAALVTSIIAGLAGMVWGWSQAQRHAAAEQQQRSRAESALAEVQLERTEDLLQVLSQGAIGLARLARVLRDDPSNAVAPQRLISVLTHRNFPLPLAQCPDVSCFAWSPDSQSLATGSTNGEVRLWALLRGRPASPRLHHAAAINHLQFSPEGERLVTASDDGTARLWLAASGKPSAALHHSNAVVWAEFSSDAKRVVTASVDGAARVWDAASGQPTTPWLFHSDRLSTARFSPDGRWLLTASWDHSTADQDAVLFDNAVTAQPTTLPSGGKEGLLHSAVQHPNASGTRAQAGSLRVWHADTGRPSEKFPHFRGGIGSASFSPDSGRVLVSDGQWVRLWEVATGKALSRPLSHPLVVLSAEFTPDGQRVVTSCYDGYLRVWDARTGQLLARWAFGRETLKPPPRGDIRAGALLERMAAAHRGGKYAELSPEGLRYASTLDDCVVQICEIAAEARRGELIPHERAVRAASFSPDGQRLLTWTADGMARAWDVRPGEAVPITLAPQEKLVRAQFSPDGRSVLTVSESGVIKVWDAFSRAVARPEVRLGEAALRADLNPEGRWLATLAPDYTARVWDVNTGEALTQALTHRGAVNHISFSPDGRRLLTAAEDRTVRVWDARSGQPVSPFLAHPRTVSWAAWSPDSQRVVTASVDGAVRVWDVQSGQPVCAPLAHERSVSFAEFLRDGKRVVTASDDGTARFWNAQTGEPLPPLLRHPGRVLAVRLNSSETLATTLSSDTTVRVWALPSGRIVVTTDRQHRMVTEVIFAPEGSRFVTADDDAMVRLWDIRTGLAVSEPFDHAYGVRRLHTLSFSPDGQRLLTASWEGARLWDAPPFPVPAPAWLPRLAEAVGGQRLNALRQLEAVAVTELMEIQQRVESSPGNDPYARWARWFFADRSTRAQSPGAAMTIAEHVQWLIDRGAETHLRQALSFSPTNRVALAHLAATLRARGTNATRFQLAEADWCEQRARQLTPR